MKNGFTLVETLIYLAIVGTVLISFVSFGLQISEIRQKNYAKIEVQSNAKSIFHWLEIKLKNAKIITNPTPGNTSSGLISFKNDEAGNEFNFMLDGDNLYYTRDTGEKIKLNSNSVRISNFNLTNLGQAGKDSLMIGFNIAYNGAIEAEKMAYEDIFRTALTLNP